MVGDDARSASTANDGGRAASWWSTFRTWPWWAQGLAWFFLLPFVLLLFTFTRPSDGRRPWWFATAAAFLLLPVLAATSEPDDEAEVATESPTTTAAERSTTTTEEPTTTTEAEPEESPEGARRSGTAEMSPEPVDDELDRSDATAADIELLDSLRVAVELSGGYDRRFFRHWDDEDGDGCDTRCEVLTAQRQKDRSWYSEWDGRTEKDSSKVHIDHVVALSEAWDSGADEWDAVMRDEFADDRANLIAVTASSNLSKSAKDAAEWSPPNADATCLWARTVVHVKAKWDLAVDQAEKDSLAQMLAGCGAVPTTTTTTVPPTTAPPPPPPPPPTTAAPAPPPPPVQNCTPGYSPCLPPASDYDCSGGSGDGPAYTGTVSVDHRYGDPYDLDRDGNGVGCQ